MSVDGVCLLRQGDEGAVTSVCNGVVDMFMGRVRDRDVSPLGFHKEIGVRDYGKEGRRCESRVLESLRYMCRPFFILFQN